eukprot:362561-Chlamydomonas_euryale.AAC.7
MSDMMVQSLTSEYIPFIIVAAISVPPLGFSSQRLTNLSTTTQRSNSLIPEQGTYPGIRVVVADAAVRAGLGAARVPDDAGDALGYTTHLLFSVDKILLAAPKAAVAKVHTVAEGERLHFGSDVLELPNCMHAQPHACPTACRRGSRVGRAVAQSPDMHVHPHSRVWQLLCQHRRARDCAAQQHDHSEDRRSPKRPPVVDIGTGKKQCRRQLHRRCWVFRQQSARGFSGSVSKRVFRQQSARGCSGSTSKRVFRQRQQEGVQAASARGCSGSVSKRVFRQRQQEGVQAASARGCSGSVSKRVFRQRQQEGVQAASARGCSGSVSKRVFRQHQQEGVQAASARGCSGSASKRVFRQRQQEGVQAAPARGFSGSVSKRLFRQRQQE